MFIFPYPNLSVVVLSQPRSCHRFSNLSVVSLFNLRVVVTFRITPTSELYVAFPYPNLSVAALFQPQCCRPFSSLSVVTFSNLRVVAPFLTSELLLLF